MARSRHNTYTMRGTAASSSGTPLHTCRDCAESYDWHSMSLKGEPILCRCRWYTEGKFCVFLKDPQCEHFIMRQKTEEEEKQHATNHGQ